VGDPSDKHQAFIIVDGIHDPVIADSNPIVVPSGELDASPRPGIFGEAVDRGRDAVTQPAVEASVHAHRLGMKAYFVRAFRRFAYVRTSDQG